LLHDATAHGELPASNPTINPEIPQRAAPPQLDRPEPVAFESNHRERRWR
jgi:hypothetical protein